MAPILQDLTYELEQSRIIFCFPFYVVVVAFMRILNTTEHLSIQYASVKLNNIKAGVHFKSTGYCFALKVEIKSQIHYPHDYKKRVLNSKNALS